MSFEEYKEIVKYTFLEEYPVYFLDMFIKKLSEEKIVHNNGRIKKYDGDLLNITVFGTIKEKIQYMFENVNEIVKKCEEFEYERAYRYSYIYRVEEFDLIKIEKLINSDKLNKFTNDNQVNDIMNEFLTTPTCKVDEKTITFKFSVRLKYKTDEKEISMKHVILVILDKTLNTVEIRQDVVPIKFHSNEDFYLEKVKSAKAWISSFIGIKLEKLDIQAIIKHMKNEKKDDVKVTAITIERDGAIAALDSGKNSDLNLPILDELRQKIYTEEIFDIDENTKKIRTLIEDFIVDIEENSLLPAAKVLWKNDGYEISTFHSKIENEEGFIKWNKTLKDKESMDYVAEYFIKCETELREQSNT